MNHPPSDMITWGMMLRKVPTIVRALPRLVRGIRVANITDPDQPCGLGWTFEQATLRNPDGAALLYGDKVLSYRQANQQANRMAHYLQAQGIGKGDVVALFIENRPELLLNVLAVAKVGGICAMLNTAQTQAALVYGLNLVTPAWLVVGAELVGGYEVVRSQVSIQADKTWFVADQQQDNVPAGYVDLMAASADHSLENPASTQQIYFNDPCFYIYTSGTTGLPKPIVHGHGGIVLVALALKVLHNDVGCSYAPN